MQTPLDDVTETVSKQNKTKGHGSKTLQHHSSKHSLISKGKTSPLLLFPW